MAFRELAVGAHLGARRGDVVVCVPLFGGHEHFVRCLRSLLDHTPWTVPIIVADDRTPDPASRAFTEGLERDGALAHEVVWLVRARNGGFVENVNGAFAVAAPADVIIVNSDVVVAEGWFEGLRDAARSDPSVGTATPLTNHGTIVSVPVRNTPQPTLPGGLELDVAAARVRGASLRLRPRLPTAIGHCVYVRRSALDLVGDFDLAFSPGYGEEVDFSQRCLRLGVQHVVADDVLVAHHGSASFSVLDQRAGIQLEHEKLINRRYPYYPDMVAAVAADETSPLARALGAAARELRGLRVTVDGRALGPANTAAQIHMLELVAALDRTGGVRVRVLVPDELGAQAAAALGSLSRVELMTVTAAGSDAVERDDILHRLWPVTRRDDDALLGKLGERIVVEQQDLIGYRNPSAFADAAAWLDHRRLSAELMAASAMTLFFSDHTRDETIAEALIEPGRARVLPIGIDHRVTAAATAPRAPVPAVYEDEPFLLCHGTGLGHENRLFALRLLDSLRWRHGWSGRLVLTRPATAAAGSAAEDEAAFLATRPTLAASVVDLGAVDEPERAWLMHHCAAVLHPSTGEGSGRAPFEAAAAGAPCVYAPHSSFTELLPEEAALIVPWDPDATSDATISVLTDPGARAAQVVRVRDAGASLSWDATGAAALDAYREAVRLPARPAAPERSESHAADGGDRAGDARYWGLRDEIGGTGLALVGPGEPLLPDEAQRALAALTRHPATRRLVVGPLVGMSRLNGRLRVLASSNGRPGPGASKRT